MPDIEQDKLDGLLKLEKDAPKTAKALDDAKAQIATVAVSIKERDTEISGLKDEIAKGVGTLEEATKKLEGFEDAKTQVTSLTEERDKAVADLATNLEQAKEQLVARLKSTYSLEDSFFEGKKLPELVSAETVLTLAKPAATVVSDPKNLGLKGDGTNPGSETAPGTDMEWALNHIAKAKEKAGVPA